MAVTRVMWTMWTIVVLLVISVSISMSQQRKETLACRPDDCLVSIAGSNVSNLTLTANLTNWVMNNRPPISCYQCCGDEKSTVDQRVQNLRNSQCTFVCDFSGIGQGLTMNSYTNTPPLTAPAYSCTDTDKKCMGTALTYYQCPSSGSA